MRSRHIFFTVLFIALVAVNAHGQMTPGETRKADNATEYYQQSLPSIFYNTKRYTNGAAYFLLDENGNLVGRQPVGIDEDDIIVVIIACPNDGTHSYKINLTGNDYAPEDLRITGKVGPAPTSAQMADKPEWTCFRFEFGPYTSEKVGFTILDKTETKAIYTIRINDLYHVFVGAAFVSSQLENPSFSVFPLNDSTSTINSYDGGSRAIATANVTWYWWPTLRYLFKGDNVNRGRDVLKEPNFMERINPTFGVAISEKVFENFFIGGTFEFARGGAIVVGGHYGKVTRLVDQDFVLGETEYSGTDNDIRTEQVNKWGLFFGISLDSRLITALGQR